MLRGVIGLAIAVLAIGAGAPSSRLSIDLEGDGELDTVLLFQGHGGITVVVRFAVASRTPERFHFVVDPVREDAVCRLPAQLEVESLDYDLAAAIGEKVVGFVRSKTSKGFEIVDGACDSIHFFWNHKTKRLEWWRL